MESRELTPGTVARLLGVETATIKRWTKLFDDYLSRGATPRSGTRRLYNRSDLQVFAVVRDYVSSLDVDEVDYSAVHSALADGCQFNPDYYEMSCVLAPIFQTIPDDFGQSAPVPRSQLIVGGMAYPGIIDIARAYRTAAETLIEAALQENSVTTWPEPYELAWPILFSYRHSVEIYLKALAPDRKGGTKTHKIQQLRDRLRHRYQVRRLGDWVEDLLSDWIAIDDSSVTFRYGDGLREKERLVDLEQLKVAMGRICDAMDQALLEDLRTRPD